MVSLYCEPRMVSLPVAAIDLVQPGVAVDLEGVVAGAAESLSLPWLPSMGVVAGGVSR